METAGLMVDVAPVVAADWERFAGLTFPAYRDLVPGGAPAGGVMPLGARAFGQPAGLLLARGGNAGAMELLSLYVAAAWRRQGVAAQLVDAWERAARAAGAARLTCVYSLPGAGAEVVAALLRRRGWTEPKPRMLVAECSVERIWAAPWVHRYVLPADFEAFPWPELTAAERDAVRAHEGRPGWYGPELSPFAGEELVPELSLGLRHGGEVVGWSLVHRAGPASLRYDNLFVNAACEPRAVALPLLAATIRRHAASGLPHHGYFNVACDNLPMIRLVQRRLLPHLISLRQTWGMDKPLAAPADR